MANEESLSEIVEDLIGVMQIQTKELEKLVARIQQVAGHLDLRDQLSVVSSELSELHVRIRKLGAASAR